MRRRKPKKKKNTAEIEQISFTSIKIAEHSVET